MNLGCLCGLALCQTAWDLCGFRSGSEKNLSVGNREGTFGGVLRVLSSNTYFLPACGRKTWVRIPALCKFKKKKNHLNLTLSHIICKTEKRGLPQRAPAEITSVGHRENNPCGFLLLCTFQRDHTRTFWYPPASFLPIPYLFPLLQCPYHGCPRISACFASLFYL